jgi:hypothetical protein
MGHFLRCKRSSRWLMKFDGKDWDSTGKRKGSETNLFELHSIIGRSNLFDPGERRSAHIRAIYCTGSPG